MTDKKDTDKTEAAKPAEKPAAKPAAKKSSGTEVTNNSSVDLKVQGVKIQKGRSAKVADFDPEIQPNKTWLGAKMISVS